MMLRRPMESMTFIDSASAPAPIESIEMTAPTPKMMPSIVSRVRSLCCTSTFSDVRRFSPSCIVGLPAPAPRARAGLAAAGTTRARRSAGAGRDAALGLVVLRLGRRLATHVDALPFRQPRLDGDAHEVPPAELHGAPLGPPTLAGHEDPRRVPVDGDG